MLPQAAFNYSRQSRNEAKVSHQPLALNLINCSFYNFQEFYYGVFTLLIAGKNSISQVSSYFCLPFIERISPLVENIIKKI